MTGIDAKKFYNEVMPSKFGMDYEHERWHKNAIQEVGYQQTKLALLRHARIDKTPHNILELGPGAGTWTKVIRSWYPTTPITLVDISGEMLSRARDQIGEDNVTYTESSFEAFNPKKQFDYFLSSRVIEYINDKDVFVDVLSRVLSPGAYGAVITKMPHYTRKKLLKKKTQSFHAGQIQPDTLCEKLKQKGFKVLATYPVTVSVPIFHSPKVNALAGKLLCALPLNVVSAFFTESYTVVFKKEV